MTANTGSPLFLLRGLTPPSPSVSSTLSPCHLQFALGSRSIYGKSKWRWSGWSMFTMKRGPGLPGPAPPHSAPCLSFFSLSRITPPTPASHRTSTPNISARHTTLPTSQPAAFAPRPSPRPPMSSRRPLTVSPTRVLSHWPVSTHTFALNSCLWAELPCKDLRTVAQKKHTLAWCFLMTSLPLVTSMY